MIIGVSPGSTVWLMAHEMRLAWRTGEDRNRWARLVLFAVLLAMMGAVGWPVGQLLHQHRPALTGIGAWVAALFFCFITFMAFMTALSLIAASFVDRGDIDLLLGSPLPRRRLLTVRLVAAALRSVALWLFLFGPSVVVTACIAGPRWLGGLVLIAGAGLVGTAAASWVILGLFRFLGPRRGRVAATIVSSLSGVTLGLGSGISGSRLPVGGQRFQQLVDSFGGSPGGLAALPARILTGDGLAMIVLGALALALFLGSAWLLAPSFSIIATRDDGQGRRTAGTAPLRGFGGRPFALLLLKDYRLLLRNHALLLQILARSIAFIPLLVINLTQQRHAPGLADIALAGTLVLGQTSGALVWAFACAETRPDLLASAPLPAALFRRTRLCASLLPALALVLLGAMLAAPQAPMAGAAILTMGTCACLASAAINAMARIAPGRRSAWGNAPRPTTASVFADMISNGLWGFSAYFIAKDSIWALLPIWLALSAVFLWREIQRRED